MDLHSQQCRNGHNNKQKLLLWEIWMLIIMFEEDFVTFDSAPDLTTGFEKK